MRLIYCLFVSFFNDLACPEVWRNKYRVDNLRGRTALQDAFQEKNMVQQACPSGNARDVEYTFSY